MLLSKATIVHHLLVNGVSYGFETVAPDSVDLDATKLAEMDALFKKEVEEGRVAGCLALVARGDKVAYVNRWGKADREADKELKNDAIFRIYSMTKPITSVAVMQLVEKGKVQLDDPASKYMPRLADVKVLVSKKNEAGEDESAQVAPDRPITVRDLLRHTSGLTYGFFGNTEVDKLYRKNGILFTDADIEETVGKLAKIPLLHQPGTRWHYSVSTDVLGRLVEVASGQRFDEYLHDHIFVPLKMVDTFFMVPEAKQSRLAQLYRPTSKNELEPANRFSSARFLNEKNKFFSGGGGLCSTTNDYFRFSLALLQNGELDGQRILSKESIHEMTKNQLPTRGFKFGLGFAIDSEGAYSWGGAAGTRFFVNPKRNLIAIFMVQIQPYQRPDYIRKIKQIVNSADLKNQQASDDQPTAPMP